MMRWKSWATEPCSVEGEPHPELEAEAELEPPDLEEMGGALSMVSAHTDDAR